MNVGFYAKAIVSILAAGLGILTAALSDGKVSPVEFVNVAIAIVTAVGVYLIPNLPDGPARVAKTIVAFSGAVLTALVTVLGNVAGWDGVAASDWLTVLLAGLGAVGVYVIPNETPTKTVVTIAASSAEGKKALMAGNLS